MCPENPGQLGPSPSCFAEPLEPKFEQLVNQLAADLKKPAGESSKFSSLDAIRANHREFVTECHKTWKKWHGEAIKQLFFFEGFLSREKTNPIGHTAVDWADYSQAIWRKASDTIIWCLMGHQRHVVKRLCLYHKRPKLTESNAQVVVELLNKLNTDSLSVAIWNDATSCVDLGGITYIENGLKPEPVFWEVKDGVVNDEIAELLKNKSESVETRIQTFHDKRGNKGDIPTPALYSPTDRFASSARLT